MPNSEGQLLPCAKVRETHCVPLPDLCPADFDPTDPMCIAEHSLEITGRALRTGNFDLFAPFFALPHKIETFGATQVLETLDDLRSVFDSSRRNNEECGITERLRVCLAAEFRDDETLLLAHETRLMQRGLMMHEPIPAYTVLKKRDGIWMAVESSYALQDDVAPFEGLLTIRGMRPAISR